jgi:hypothetical protein
MEMSSNNGKYQPKNGEISVFVNDKGDNPKRPDFTGTLTLDGTDYKVKFWKTIAKTSGQVFLNGNVEPKTTEVTADQKAALDAFGV